MKKGIFVMAILAAFLLASCNTPSNVRATEMGLTPITFQPTPETVSQNVAFREGFEKDINNSWGEKILSGVAKQLIINQAENRMRVELLAGNDTNFVFFNKDGNYKDVLVQAEVQYMISSNNSVAVICRASEKGWYEFRINNLGFYELLKFDQYLKDQGKNAYTNLIGGQFRTPLVKTGTEKNTFALSCVGSQFKIYINGEQVFHSKLPIAVNDTSFTEGTIGFGVEGYGNPSDLNFSYVEALKP